jgi:hypothetical protein
MKKKRVLGLVLFIMAASAAIAAVPAFAEEETAAEWLANGAAITMALAATTNMELLITENTGIGKFAILCSMLLDGTVGPKSEDAITEMLNLSGEKIAEFKEPPGLGLLCEAREGCATGTDIELWPEKLPWETLLDKMENGRFLDHIHIAFAYTCLFLGSPTKDQCEGLTSAEMVNVTGGVEPRFSAGAGTESLRCKAGGEGSGSIATEGSPLITLNGGEALTVS